MSPRTTWDSEAGERFPFVPLPVHAQSVRRVNAVREIASSLPHNCWWDGDVTGNMQGTETCTRCRLEAALGGTDE